MISLKYYSILKYYNNLKHYIVINLKYYNNHKYYINLKYDNNFTYITITYLSILITYASEMYILCCYLVVLWAVWIGYLKHYIWITDFNWSE